MKVYLIFSATDSILSKLIGAYTQKPYNHVSIAFDENLKNVYSFGRKKISNPLIGGFVKEDFYHPFFLCSQCRVYSLDITLEQLNSLKALIHYFEDRQQDLQYNFIGLLTLALNFNFERQNAYFCSQFVATILKEANVCSFTKKSHFIKPYDLMDEVPLVLEYEGSVVNYLDSLALIHRVS
ncbi:hypothetical protein [Vagococcus sp.]|uniref:hypothetical protein n=1 Tax=Vagococcus sp. TaxID=1933889 RepID=UPI003F977EBB